MKEEVIKDSEIAMVKSATLVLEYQAKHPKGWPDDAIAYAMQNLNAKSNAKLYALAAANEILKMKKSNPVMTDKQLIQSFVNTIPRFIADINQNNI
jgi:hypothetical protein